MRKQGTFIAVGGGDGSGKGTILKHLEKTLRGESVLFTREPGGTPLGEKIRSVLLGNEMSTLAELLLFEAARAEHMEKVIIPALKRGTHVVSDRFDACTYAYQVFARWNKRHTEFFRLVNAEVVGKYSPDLYLFCDITPRVALSRRMSAGGEVTRFDKENLKFHEAVYRGYKEFLRDKRFVSVDATQEMTAMCRSAEAVVRTELGL